MNAGQYEGLMGMLREIRDRMPEAATEPAGPLTVHHLDGTKTVTVPVDRGGPLGRAGERGAHRALARFLGVLDGWIEGARSNHDALDHRGESRGEECWTQFHPSDIRRMVNDAAREVGLSTEFADPEVATEDKVR